MLSNVRGATYEEKLRDAGLTTLKERRARGDAIQTFKVLKGFSEVPKERWFQLVADDARPTRTTARIEGDNVVKEEAVLVVERARLETRRNFFSIRAAKEWNELPEIVKNSTSTYACAVKNYSSRQMQSCNTAVNDALRLIFGYNRWDWESVRALRYKSVTDIFGQARKKFSYRLPYHSNSAIVSRLARYYNLPVE